MNTNIKRTHETASPMITDRDLLLQLIAQHEFAVAELYGLFAKQLDNPKFWRRLKREEELHGKLLTDLAAAVAHGEATFEIVGLSINSVQTALTSVRQHLRIWKAKGVDPKEAYTYAVLLEKSMLEHHFFAVAPQDSPFTEEILKTLMQATGQHEQRIRRMGRKYLSSFSWLWRALDKFEELTAA